MILFVGLGNPTDKYINTRHNIGFMVIDNLINTLNPANSTKSKFQGLLYKDKNILLLKPQTYMNLSGFSVQAVCSYFKPDKVVVIHDDLDLNFGIVRFKIGGSNGGHNGLKSIDACIGVNYERVRLGIGRSSNGLDSASFVLSNFSKEEDACLKKIIIHASDACLELSKKSLEEVRQKFTANKGLC